MVSTDFAYFISFLVFAFLAYKYGHKVMRKVLDEKIQFISDSLTQGNKEKENAQLALSAVKSELHTFENTLKDKFVEVESRITAFQEQQRRQLIEFILEREKHHRATLEVEREQQLKIFSAEITAAVLRHVEEIFEHSPPLRKAYQEQSFSLIEAALKTK